MNTHAASHHANPDSVASLARHPNNVVASIFSVERHPAMYARTGYILRLAMVNFLTHRDRTVDFTHPVSLIHGPNGAGKSSILQAIHFVLGGKAKNIRNNCDSFLGLKTVVCSKDTGANVQTAQSSVTVYFYYPGNDEFPGPILAIRRTISSAIATFSLCSTFPRTSKDTLSFERVSSDRVHAILLSMGHFPDNELTMVSQVKMKQLVNMRPTDRYKQFSEAAFFAKIESNLGQTQTSLRNSVEEIETLMKSMKNLMHERKRLVKRIKGMQEYHMINLNLSEVSLRRLALGIQKQRVQLQNKRLEIVAVEQGELVQLVDAHKSHQDAKTNCDQHINKCKADIEQLNDVLDEAKRAFTNVHIELGLKTQALEKTTRRINDIEADLLSGSSKSEKLQTELEHNEAVLKSIPKREADIPAPVKAQEHISLESEEVLLNKELIKLDEKREQLMSALRTLNKRFDDRKAYEEIDRGKCKALEEQIAYYQDRIKQAADKSTVRDGCIKSMTEKNRNIYRLVSNEMFAGDILAPLAAHIWIKSSAADVAPIIRRLIKGELLNAIAFKNKSDQDKLSRILGKSNGMTHLIRPTMPTLAASEKLFTELSPSHKRMVTPLLSTLEASSPIALEFLELKIKVSNVIICENSEVAREVLRIGNKIRISFRCIPKDKDCVMYSNQTNSIIMQPEYARAESMQYQTLYLAVTDIRGIQKKIEEMQGQYAALKQHVDEKYAAEKKAALEANDQREHEKLQGDLDTVNTSITTSTKRLEHVREQLRNLRSDYSRKLNEHNQVQSILADDQKTYNKALAVVELRKAEIQRLQQRYTELTEARHAASIALEEERQAVENIKVDYAQKETRVNQLTEDLNNKIAYLDKVTATDLDQQLMQSEKAIAVCRGKIDTLRTLLTEAQQRILLDLKTLVDTYTNLEELIPAYSKRKYEVLLRLTSNGKTDGLTPVLIPHTAKELSPSRMMEHSKALYENLCSSESHDGTTSYVSVFTKLAYLLSDFLADYAVFSEAQDVIASNTSPDCTKATNTQHLANLDGRISVCAVEQNQLEERRNVLSLEFGGDIEMEEQELLRLDSRIQHFKAKSDDTTSWFVSLSNMFVSEIIKLAALRTRAENDMYFHFHKNAQIAGINQFLVFQFPELPAISSKLLNIIDQEIADKYYGVCDTQRHDGSFTQPQADSSTLDTNSQSAPKRPGDGSLVPTVVTTNGSIEIKSSTRAATSLSGGESTFISLCFMISCWLIMNTTYAQIDEWDVFMDANRRKLAFQLMMNVLMQTSIQVVLVTPNDVDIAELTNEAQKLVGVVKLLSIRN